MTLQHQWGSVGMALALTASLSVCGAGVAQTAISTTPPHVCDLASPAPRAQVARDFTAGTTGQTADAIARVALPDRKFDFTLNSPVMGHTDTDGRVIGRLPTDVSLTRVILHDIAEMGEASLSRANLPTLAVYSGDTFLGTANYDTTATAAAQEIPVKLADGSTVTLRPVVYAFTDPVEVNAGTAYTLRLNAAGVTPVLPLFTNAASHAGFGILHHETAAPYVTFVCQGSVNVETIAVSADTELSDLVYTDNNGTAVVFTLGAGVTLTLDKRVQSATLIFETAAPAANAPTVAFENINFPGAFVFRNAKDSDNAKGSDNGAIRVSGPWQDSSDKDSNTTWNPAALTVDCDLILASPLPFRDGNWFQGNKVRVLPGRTLRLETEANTPSRLPDVLLTAPTANLAFAGEGKTGALPAKYSDLFFGTSGTVTLERTVAFNYNGNESDSQGSLFRIGNQGDAGYAFTLNVDKNFSSLSRLVLGGDSGSTTLNLRGDEATTYAAVINFDSNSTLTQSAGQLTLGGNGWATWFLGNSSTLVFGDSDTLNGTATATLNGIPYGSSTGGVTTDYTGAADLTVNADATLVLNKTAAVDKTTDYAFYPAGKRSLKVAGGTVRANTGAAVTMTFESPEPLAVPLAVAPIPGLEVAGSAALESADATSSSLTLDALKGNGDVTLSGIVHIETVRIEAGKELNLDLRKGTDGADDAIGGSRVTVDAVTGSAGTVRFGLLGTNGTTGEQTVIDSLLAGGFTGTVGFLMPDYSTLDFEDTQLPALPFTLEVQPGQTVVMRLDQYADADILWPEDCSNVKLVLVEAGPFGGEAPLPAWPKDVIFEFHRYDTGSDNIPGSASTHSPIAKPNYDVSFDVNQGTVDLTWKDPVLTGKVAWIDMEFNGDSRNSGWYRLGDDDHNGMLSGWTDAESQGAGELITAGSAFKTTHNPQSEGLDNTYKAYLSDKTFRLPEEQWSIVARIQAPAGFATDVDSMLHSNSALLAIGSNYQAQSTDGVLVLATGELKNDRRTSIGLSSDIDTRTDELILWFIPRNDGDSMVRLATARVPNVTDSWHLFTITYDNGVVSIWLEENQLMRCVLPPNTTIGPGLQIGQTMGGTNRDEGIYNTIHDIGDNWTIDGCFDFLRVYRGILTESARESLVRQYPYVHKEIYDLDQTRDVRYVRELDGGTQYWVDNENKPWTRYYKGSGIWSSTGKYAEPAEGALVILECKSDTTLLVNTTKHDQFPSANRTYAQLIVKGGGTLGNRYGKLTIKPCEDWKTATTPDGEYTYGRLIFSGGAGESVSLRDDSDEGNGGGTNAVYTWNNAVFWASVVDFSRAGFSFKEERHVEMRVDTETEGSTFFRGVEEELMFVRQLTGTVSGTGYFDRNDDAIAAAYGQNSEFVWVPGYNGLNPWKVDDVTREYNDTNGDGTCDGTEIVDSGNGVLLPQEGLFVRCMKVPGTLYLEQHVDSEVPENGALSKQKWYRYGYHDDTAAESPWNLAPEEAKEGDFEKAVVLKIRLEDGQTKTLRVDQATTLQELIVEEPAAKYNPTDADEGLVLLPADNGTRLTVTDAVTTARPLNVYDASAFSTETGGTGADAILLRPKTEEVVDVETGETTTVVTGGTLLHGVVQGAYAAGNSTINHPLDGSSIARIESVNAIAFTAAQNLPATTVAAAEKATVTQTNADNAFHAGAMELAEGSRFTFASSEASVDGAVTLTDDATLEGTGTAARLTPVAGIAGQTGSETLTLDAAKGASWKLLNSEVGNLPLTKTGAGTADIATDLPPNAGKVDVQAGTLAVATGLAGEHQAVGQAGLNVEAGATLAPTASTIDTDVLAEIPAEQTVSGLGRIDGTLRLETDATLDATTATATDDGSLSVRDVQTDGLTALADVGVSLPENTAEGLVFLRSDETKLNWTARARLLATANATRWDVLLRYRRNAEEATEGTNYLVGAAGLDVPNFDTIPEEVPEEDRPSKDEADENNKWPDGTGDNPAIDDEVTDQIQDGGNIAGEAEGYTMANTKWLMAPDIANAYACFGDVWTLAPRSVDPQSEDYATRDLLMAYEFGISRMAFTQDNTHIVIEATLRNALKDCGYFTDEQLQGAGALKPTFLDGVSVAIVGSNGPIEGVEELTATEVEHYGFTPIETANETSRWFLVPYYDTNFPEGLTVQAIPAAEQSPAAE